jgi:tellurite resistance protein TehA-like permease
VGTCVTGTIALAASTDAVALRLATVLLYALLLGTWLVVAVDTARRSATGRLSRPTSPRGTRPQSS